MRPELRDEDIARGLERRGAGEWQPERMLPAVRRAISIQPPSGRATPRWVALAGLVGVVGVLVVVALAMPLLPNLPMGSPSAPSAIAPASQHPGPSPTAVPDVSPATSPVPGVVRWELDPAERLSVATRTLRLMVRERVCANVPRGGREYGVEVDYGERGVTITLSSPAAVAGSCPLEWMPFTVALTEPLGQRSLWDGVAQPPIERARVSNGLLVLVSDEPEMIAQMRFEKMAQAPPDCLGFIEAEDPTPDVARLREATLQLAGSDGLVPFETGYLGEWEDAARAFGAIEAYRGEPKPWLFVARNNGQRWITDWGGHMGYALATLWPVDIGGGDTVWIPVHRVEVSRGRSSCGEIAEDPPAAVDRSGDFQLAIAADEAIYGRGEPINIEATLTYGGATRSSVDPWSNGLVWFRVDQVDGELTMDPVRMDICQRFDLLDAGVPRTTPFFKGGYALPDPSDPNADFLRRYWEDPELRLPAGVWRITATSHFGIGDCNVNSVALEASILITVR